MAIVEIAWIVADSNQDGHVDWHELQIIEQQQLLPVRTPDRFYAANVDGDNALNHNELLTVLTKVGISPNLSPH